MQLCVQVKPSIKMKISLYFLLLLENSGRFSLPRYSAKEIRSPHWEIKWHRTSIKQRRDLQIHPAEKIWLPKSTRLDCHSWINKHIWERKYQLIESQSTRKAYKRRFVVTNIGRACSSTVQEKRRFWTLVYTLQMEQKAISSMGMNVRNEKNWRIWQHHWSITSYSPYPKMDTTRFLSWCI